MRDVEEARRLIEEEHFRVLCNRHGDPRTLALTARKRLDGTLGKVHHVRLFECPIDDAPVLPRRACEKFRAVRRTTVADELAHAESCGRGRVLRQDRETPCQLAAVRLGDARAIEENFAVKCWLNAADRLQKCRLAAAVRTNQCGDLARGDLEVHIFNDDGAVIARLQISSFKLHSIRPFSPCCGRVYRGNTAHRSTIRRDRRASRRAR